jgi:hypothetical protein
MLLRAEMNDEQRTTQLLVPASISGFDFPARSLLAFGAGGTPGEDPCCERHVGASRKTASTQREDVRLRAHFGIGGGSRVASQSQGHALCSLGTGQSSKEGSSGMKAILESYLSQKQEAVNAYHQEDA